jgi:hypothetical protein
MNTRVLFVPVSAPRGMGEYARCLTLAETLVARRRDVVPHFLLSREAPYASQCPFEHTLLPRSPTLSGEATTAALLRVGARMVVFDNAGRSSHIQAAARSGAAVIYISSRTRQRAKAFRLRWMGRLAEHWIALPECRETRLTPYEYAKLCWHPAAPQVRFIDVVLPERSTAAHAALFPSARVLVVPGSGTAHPGAADGPQVFADAAAKIEAAGHDVLYVGPRVAPGDAARLRQVERVPGGVLRTLMERAELVVTNGGDTLLQALALGKACVAAPIARDQPARLAMLLQGVRVARLEAAEIAEACRGLLQDAVALARLRRVASGLEVRDRREQACDALLQLLDREQRPHRLDLADPGLTSAAG